MTRFHVLIAAAIALAAITALLATGLMRVALVGAVVAVFVLVLSLGVFLLPLQLFGPSVCRVRTKEKVVALTFDDGPDPACTPVLLDLLKKKGIRAAFFCTGANVRRNPSLASRISAEGHLVENHSFEHSNWTNLFGLERLRRDIDEAQQQIQQATGRKPLFFRPPVGLSNPRVFRAVAECGLTVVGWSARGLDTRDAPAPRILERIMRRVRPGGIIVLHDGGHPPDRLLGLVDSLVDRVRAGGYQFTPLDQLIRKAETR